MEEVEIKFQDIFRILRSRWKVVTCVTILIICLITIFSCFITKPVYEVSTKVFIGKEENRNSEYNNNDVVMYLNLLDTYSELIKTNDLIKNAIDKNDLNITPTEVAKGLEVTPKTDTQILQITYKNSDNKLAKDVIVAIVDEFVKESKELIQNGTVTVIENAQLPEYPVTPNKVKNIVIASVVGVMLGSVIALLLEYMDDTIKTKEQTEKITGIPVIGMIPIENNGHENCKNKHKKKKCKEIKKPVYDN